MVKKSASKKSNGNSALGAAIKDLQSEINSLTKERSSLKRSLDDTSSAINVDRDMEKKLQQRIALLLEKETNLNHKKKLLQTKIDSVSDKMGKISKIRSEMSDI